VGAGVILVPDLLGSRPVAVTACALASPADPVFGGCWRNAARHILLIDGERQTRARRRAMPFDIPPTSLAVQFHDPQTPVVLLDELSVVRAAERLRVSSP
jgi:hypothetical protein